MSGVAEGDGTAQRFFNESKYEDVQKNIAAKTGTAEKLSKEGTYGKRNHVVSFCGFVPVADPQFTILIILDNPTKYTFGGTAAAPVFKEIAERLLVMKGVKPDQVDFE